MGVHGPHLAMLSRDHKIKTHGSLNVSLSVFVMYNDHSRGGLAYTQILIRFTSLFPRLLLSPPPHPNPPKSVAMFRLIFYVTV